MPNRFVYYFGNGYADGGREDKSLLGGKGANLAEMTRIGIPVPPGFTITTEVCRLYLRDLRYPDGITQQVEENVRRLEADTGKTLGGSEAPLLVSVRSGGAVSMPGMMETILNLGLNDESVEALARESGDPRFAYDSYRRFVQMYGDVVLGVHGSAFEKRLTALKRERGVEEDMDLSADDLRALVAEFKAIVREHSGERFPEDPEEQLWGAIEAVFRSWNAERAIAYRRVHGIPDYMGTAVSVVAMAYGNMGNDSGTGVAFTRNPSTGERKFFGEFLVNAQGEDVVAGIRTPLSIDQMATKLPAAYEQLLVVQDKLEQHYREMQDLEFTVERGRLYLLQTRTGKRTARAAIRIATEMVAEGLIDEAEAVRRIDPKQLDQLLHPRLDPAAEVNVLVTGLPASPGAASGRVVFDPDTAAARAAEGEPVILVREETSPDDFHGMVAAQAVVTARGGMTSHAAVVARGMGKCCVVGASGLAVDHDGGCCSSGDVTVNEGDWITVDGTTGRVLIGQVGTVEPELGDDFHLLMSWADELRTMKVRANADTPGDAAKAREFGAEGIGLCRTEHMFFDAERVQAVREMILADAAEARTEAINRLLPMQRADFEGIFRAMDGFPVTIRLLDPPLHEFLPALVDQSLLVQRLELTGGDKEELDRAKVLLGQVKRLHEQNPMLGTRGCRLAMLYPEIPAMQARAIVRAALAVREREGETAGVEIMIPLVAYAAELSSQRAVVEQVVAQELEAAGAELDVSVGTMIELPRACVVADQIAEHADFFSFGTNDLTQTGIGISRDDAEGGFLSDYVNEEVIPNNPFESIDRDGVGGLVRIGVEKGRAAKPGLKLGVCGEHGGDPSSILLFDELGLDYVSCSPFRVPIARFAAARAVLGAEKRADG